MTKTLTQTFYSYIIHQYIYTLYIVQRTSYMKIKFSNLQTQNSEIRNNFDADFDTDTIFIRFSSAL